MIVIHDDMDMVFGQDADCLGGRDGGHKGVRSVIESLGGREFLAPQDRHREEPSMPGEEYVLSRFDGDEAGELAEIIDIACDALKVFVFEGGSKAMSLFNKRGPE